MSWVPESHGWLWRPWEVARGGQGHADLPGACGCPACPAAVQVASGCHCGSSGHGCSWECRPPPPLAGSCEHPPLAEPVPPASPRSAASFWWTGSMSFCQLRSSFLARLASSSFFVFLRTSLMSFPSRVSYNQRETMTCFGTRSPPWKGS